MIGFDLGSTSTEGEGEGDGVEVVGTVRTSGTEPKVRRLSLSFAASRSSRTCALTLSRHCPRTQIKFYLEARGADRAAVRLKLERVREALGDEWLRWKENGLERA